MARLGEAYVRVRADLKDFNDDLDKSLKASTEKFEKSFNAQLGKKLGKNVGSGMASELDASLKQSAKVFGANFERESGEGGKRGGKRARDGFEDAFFDGLHGFATTVGSVISDGLSGLPREVRAILGGVVISAALPLSAALAGAITSGTAIGVAGLGIALASQFDIVQESATDLKERLRQTFVDVARPFVDPILETFGRVEQFVNNIEPRLRSMFENSARFIDPLVSGLLIGLDAITSGIDYLVAHSGGVVDVVAEGFVELGAAIEESMMILGDLGEDGEVALRDLLFATSDLIVFMAKLLDGATKTYAIFRQNAQATDALGIALKTLFPQLILAKLAFDNIDSSAKITRSELMEYDATTGRWVRTQKAAITATDEQTKALKAEADAFDEARRAQFRAVDSTIAYLDSIDDLKRTLKENKGAFTFDTEKGREGIAKVGTALQEAEQRVKDLAVAGKITSDQALALYRQEREEIYKVAEAQGVSRAKIDEIYGAITDVLNLPPIDDKFKLLASGISQAQENARELRKEIQRGGFSPPIAKRYGGVPFPQYANGGIIDSAQVAMIGEGNRREVVLPLTNPSRTRELAQQSGLMNILGSDGANTVIVYVGNEQLDSRMYRVANRNSRDQARMMTQAPRMN